MMGRKLSIELKPKGVDVIIMDPGWNKTVRSFELSSFARVAIVARRDATVDY